jgi:hypothetical protein
LGIASQFIRIRRQLKKGGTTGVKMKHSQLNGVQSALAAANKRRLMLLAAVSGALLALSTLAQAQGAFPNKPII